MIFFIGRNLRGDEITFYVHSTKKWAAAHNAVNLIGDIAPTCGTQNTKGVNF